MMALVDCNSFYCSCEIAFRPDLEKRPVVVLSNNDGCVVSRNQLAKDLNIKMAQPFYEIKDIIHRYGVSYFSSNFALYADLSSRIMRTLAYFSPEMEIYSIDEAFLDLSGFEHYDLRTYGQLIQDKIYKNIHIPVSIGIAPTKVLTKIANYLAKKSAKAKGVVDLSSAKFHDIALSMVPIEDVWGIGYRSASKLKILGIKNALQFRDYSNEKQIEKLLTKVGLQIKYELKGVSCLPIELFAEKKKQIISSRTFGRPVYSFIELEQAVATYITTAAEKLRSQKSVTSLLTVYIRTNPFKGGPQYYNLGSRHFFSGTWDTRKLIAAGLEILEDIYKPGFEYKKAGVMLNNINDKMENQLALFGKFDSKKDDQLMEAVDKINNRNGRGTVKIASCGIEQQWGMSREFKSPCYTTRWGDIPKVR